MIFTEEATEALAMHARKTFAFETKVYYSLLSILRERMYDEHVVSWLSLNYWHVEVGDNGEWRLA